MTKFIVCDKWELEIGSDLLAHVKSIYGPGRSYLQFVNEEPDQVGAEAWAAERLLGYIATKYDGNMDEVPLSVAEYFGGIGLWATIAQRVLSMEHYATNDKCPLCFQHLSKLQRQGYYNAVYKVHWVDLVASDAFDSDIVLLDFNSFTLHQLMTYDSLHHAFHDIVELNPSIIVLTDTAISRMAPHKSKYEGHADMPIECTEDYIHALSKVLYTHYHEYAITHAVYHSRAMYTILQYRINFPKHIIIDRVPAGAAASYFRRA